jgi:hypothetical protein
MTPQLVNYGLNTRLKNGERGEKGMMNHGQPVGAGQTYCPSFVGNFPSATGSQVVS